MKNYSPQGPDIIDLGGLDFGGLDGPGGSKNNSKGCGANEAPHLLEWFLGAPGPSRPLTTMVSGSWGGFMFILIRSWGYPGFFVDPPLYQAKKRRRGSAASEAKRATTWHVMQHMHR